MLATTALGGRSNDFVGHISMDRKRKSEDVSDIREDSFFLSSARGQVASVQNFNKESKQIKRFRKTKSYKSFHDLTLSQEESSSEDLISSSSSSSDSVSKVIMTQGHMTPYCNMFDSRFKARPGVSIPTPAVSDNGSACSSRRNSAGGSNDNLLAMMGSGICGSESPRSVPPTSTTLLDVPPPSPKATQPKPKSGWGWFINMDLPQKESRQLSTSRRVVSMNSLHDMPLAFVKEDVALTCLPTEEDKSVKWAKAADVVDELFGGLDLPGF